MSEENKTVNEERKSSKKKTITHIVKKGDTVTGIAKKYLGKSSRAVEIRQANNLATDILRVGRVLKIPKK